MEINKILLKYGEKKEKNILVLNDRGDLIYESKIMDIPPEVLTDRLKNTFNDFDEQEYFDKDREIYIRVSKTDVEEGGEIYHCFQFADISEYALLVREVASYTKSVSSMSKFQTSIMKKLSMSYDTFLPGLATYCRAEEVMMLIKNSGKVTLSIYRNELTRVTVGRPEEYAHYFSLERGETKDGFFCILNSKVQEQDCVVLVKKNSDQSGIDPMDISIYNVISLFIENSILRDKIVYESEHDKLTGLYNKGKYMSLKKTDFGSPGSIAIYNFDVNNLKNINDHYGHEYGDALIIKAAKSINAVTSENVLGFRMGGDEYVMVAANISRREAEELRVRWKESLDRLNREDSSIFCSMACGLSWGSGEYDYDDLYAKADKLMYEDKKILKSNGITSHING